MRRSFRPPLRFSFPIGSGQRVMVILVIDLRAWALWWFRQRGRYPIFAASFGPLHLWTEVQRATHSTQEVRTS